MEMKLKLAPGVQPTQEQLREIANSIMAEPDMGWKPTEFDTVAEKEEWEKKTTWLEVQDCDYGKYTVRINLFRALMTILKIED